MTPAEKPARPRILVLDPIHEQGIAMLRERAEVSVNTGLRGTALLAAAGDYHAIIVGHNTRVSATLIEAAVQLQVIGVIGAKLDHIHVGAVQAHGIDIVSAHDWAATENAEQALRLILNLNQPLAGRTLGIVGFGQVGSEVARRANAFDMRVLVNQPRPTLELAVAEGVERMDLDDVLDQADILCVFVTRSKDTTPVLNAAHLARIKPHAHVINMSHPEAIDPRALASALRSGHVATAALTTSGEDAPLPTEITGDPAVTVVRLGHRTAEEAGYEVSSNLVTRVLAALDSYKAGNPIGLVVAPIDRVVPHEHFDPERVAALAARLATEEFLLNPPIAIQSDGYFIVLDGATRTNAFRQLNYPHMVLQVVERDDPSLALHVWHHALTGVDGATLLDRLQRVPNMRLQRTTTAKADTALAWGAAFAIFRTLDGRSYLALPNPDADRLTVTNDFVAAYTRLATIVRTTETDPAHLRLSELGGLVVFPPFSVDDVIQAGITRKLLPAGVTRFVIPGRVLRINADLNKLRADQPTSRKQAWIDKLVATKQYNRKIRRYDEPVVLLDE